MAAAATGPPLWAQKKSAVAIAVGNAANDAVEQALSKQGSRIWDAVSAKLAEAVTDTDMFNPKE